MCVYEVLKLRFKIRFLSTCKCLHESFNFNLMKSDTKRLLSRGCLLFLSEKGINLIAGRI